MEVKVELIETAASYPLRHAILRPQQDSATVAWEGDDDLGTATFGAVDQVSRDVLSVATVFRETAPCRPVDVGLAVGMGGDKTTWRLRGMATRADLQGNGLGSMVINAVFDYVADNGGDLIWCNARVRAVAFYKRAGFVTWGSEWTLPSIGPHVVMWRRIEEEVMT